MYATYLHLCAHVSDSDVDVIRKARRKIAKRARRKRHLRDQRHAFYLEMLRYHHQWQELCHHFRM